MDRAWTAHATNSQLRLEPVRFSMSNALATVFTQSEDVDDSLGAADHSRSQCAVTPIPGRISVIDDEYFAREGVCGLLRDAGWDVESFCSCEAFLATHRTRPNTCIVLDLHFPGMGGLELLRRMADVVNAPPMIVLSGSHEISEAVQSMKQGALDFIEKPVVKDILIASVGRAFERSQHFGKISESRDAARGHLTDLTLRQHQILDLVLAGQPSKNIAADLGISQRTVENHRASIMHRTGARSLPALAQLVMCHRCVQDK